MTPKNDWWGATATVLRALSCPVCPFAAPANFSLVFGCGIWYLTWLFGGNAAKRCATRIEL